MNRKVRQAFEAIQQTLTNNVRDLSPSDYKEVLEELDNDVEGRLEALRDEHRELFD